MSLTTTKKISLDFYNYSIETVNAKQFDSKSRFINITCTDHGQKRTLDPSLVDAYVGFDGEDGIVKAQIEEDGTITADLSPMLEIEGRHKVEVIIFAASTTVLDLTNETTIKDLNGTIISTMTFYLNVISSIIKDDGFESDQNLIGLRSVLLRAATTEARMKALEDTLSSEEEIRKANEKTRIDNEDARSKTETDRQNEESERQRIFGDSDDTIEDGTMYGVMNSTNSLYTEAKLLVGDKTDDSSKDTLYGIKQLIIESENDREEIFDNKIQACEEATDAANNIANSKADKDHVHDDKYMAINNPTGNGTLSLNRKNSTTIGTYSATVGMDNMASGDYGSFAEGSQNTVSGWSAHVEGRSNEVSGNYGHGEGYDVKVTSDYGHAEGNGTIAASKSQHVQGKFNIEDSAEKYAHIVGNGSSNSARSNAHTVDWDGNSWFKGDVYVGGTDQTTGNALAKEKDLNAVNNTLQDYITNSTKKHDNIDSQLHILLNLAQRCRGGVVDEYIKIEEENDMYTMKTLNREIINTMLGTDYDAASFTRNVYIQIMNGDTGGNGAKIIATAYNTSDDHLNVYFNQKTSGNFRFVYFIYHFGGSYTGGDTA